MTTAPPCFGKKWDSSDKLCSGGLDPDFKDEETGSSRRPRCAFFSECSQRTSMKLQEEMRSKTLPVLPSNTPPPQPVASFQQFRSAAVQPTPAPSVFSRFQPTREEPAPTHHPVMWPTSSSIPVNYQMPAYLTVPEERGVDESVWAVLGRELFRSGAKAVGHTIAAFFDRTRLKDRQG